MNKRLLKGLHGKVFDRPLLVTQQALAPIVDYMLNPIRAEDFESTSKEKDSVLLRSEFGNDKDYQSYLADYYNVNLETGVGHLLVEGTLVNKSGQIQACVELTSYERLVSDFKQQVSLGINTCVMTFDSGGGEAYRCFASAMVLRKLADENGVKLIAYVDGLSASASYALTSVCDEIIVNPQSQVGSIGVVVQLYNDSEYLKKIGVERSFVFAGDNKIPFDKKGSFKEDFITSLQTRVDKTYETFVSHVASNRGLSVEDVKATKAGVFDADEALKLGLIDQVMEIEDFNDYISSVSVEKENRTQTNTGIDMSTQNLNVEQLNEKLAVKDKEVAKLTTDLEKLNQALQDSVIAKEKAELSLSEFKEGQKLSARKEKLSAIFGKESAKVEQYSTMFASLDDASFEALTTELTVSKEKQSKEMTELGHENLEKPLTDGVQTLEDLAKARGNKYKKNGDA